MLHVMIDLETFGVKPWSVIRSVGAVSFDIRDPKPSFPHEFYANVTRESCEELGLVVDRGVEQWWSKQSAESRAALDADQVPVDAALENLSSWYASTGATTVWCQGAAFDFPILDTAYGFCGLRPPWHYRRIRDTRTAYHILGFNPDGRERDGVYHNALDDCKHQVTMLREALHGR